VKGKFIRISKILQKVSSPLPVKVENLHRISIVCRDQENSLYKLLEYIRRIGNQGHSFDIVVDPDNSECKQNFSWDGDGSDKIFSIEKTSAECTEGEE